jgi:hypothetical protein
MQAIYSFNSHTSDVSVFSNLSIRGLTRRLFRKLRELFQYTTENESLHTSIAVLQKTLAAPNRNLQSEEVQKAFLVAVADLMNAYINAESDNQSLRVELNKYHGHEYRKQKFAQQRQKIQTLCEKQKEQNKYPPYTDAIEFYLTSYGEFISKTNLDPQAKTYSLDQAIYQDDLNNIDPALVTALRRACPKVGKDFTALLPPMHERTILIARENIGSDLDIAKAKRSLLQKQSRTNKTIAPAKSVEVAPSNPANTASRRHIQKHRELHTT